MKKEKVFTKEAFEWEFGYRNTVVDTFLIMAPKDEEYMVHLASELTDYNQTEI